MRLLSNKLLMVFCLILSPLSLKAEVVDQILAEVNGEIITYSELKRVLDPIYSQYSKVFGGNELITRIRQARAEALDQLIENKLIIQEAESLGVQLGQQVIKDRVWEIKAQFKNEEEFLSVLKNQGTPYDLFVEQVNEQLLVKAFINHEVTSKVTVTPKNIQEYYQKNKELFNIPAQVHLYHIMVKKEANDLILSNETIRQIRLKAEQGDSFIDLAKNYSEGPNAVKGGDLGWVKKGQLIQNLDLPAFALKENEVSQIIDADKAYHLLWVKEKKESVVRELSDVEGEVEEKVFRKKATELHTKWIASLKKKAYIHIFE